MDEVTLFIDDASTSAAISCDLSEAFLVEANLSEADLSEAFLESGSLLAADLSNANLFRANFQCFFKIFTISTQYSHMQSASCYILYVR